MVYRVFSRFFCRRVLHFKGRLICQIFAKNIKMFSDFALRFIFRSSYAWKNMVFQLCFFIKWLLFDLGLLIMWLLFPLGFLS